MGEAMIWLMLRLRVSFATKNGIAAICQSEWYASSAAGRFQKAAGDVAVVVGTVIDATVGILGPIILAHY